MNNINMHRINNAIRPIQQNSIKKNENNSNTSFNETLNNIQSKEIKFSKHAKARMDKREIEINKAEMVKLEEAIDKADKKGVKEALIIMNNQAFIASVKNKTIITAVSNDKLSENVFTNIDGAIII